MYDKIRDGQRKRGRDTEEKTNTSLFFEAPSHWLHLREKTESSKQKIEEEKKNGGGWCEEQKRWTDGGIKPFKKKMREHQKRKKDGQFKGI